MRRRVAANSVDSSATARPKPESPDFFLYMMHNLNILYIYICIYICIYIYMYCCITQYLCVTLEV